MWKIRPVALFVAIACIGGTLLAVADVTSDHASEQIQQLHSQKIEILQDLVDRYKFANSHGKPVLDEMLAAESKLLRAKLEIAQSTADRIELHELLLKNRETLVEVKIAGKELGRVAEVEILTSRVAKLEAEIELATVRAALADGR